MNAKLLIFDFDGTLADSHKGIFETFNYTFDKLGCKKISQSFFEDLVGMPLEKLFEAALSEGKKDLIEKACGIYRKRYRKICVKKTVLFPHVKETLLFLKSKGVKMAVVTTKKTELVSIMLEALKISGLFDFVVGGDKVSKHKPDPEGINLVIKKLEGKKESTVIVGDRRFDIDVGKNAGIKTIAVTYAPKKEALEADLEISDFAELRKIGV